MSKLTLQAAARELISSHAVSCYPNEACGALIGVRRDDGIAIEAARGLPNRLSVHGGDRFEIEPLAYGRLERELAVAGAGNGPRIVGFFHSHPDALARPSSIDLEMALGLFEVAREYYVYAIQSVTAHGAGELTFWRLRAHRGDFEELYADGNLP